MLLSIFNCVSIHSELFVFDFISFNTFLMNLDENVLVCLLYNSARNAKCVELFVTRSNLKLNRAWLQNINLINKRNTRTHQHTANT